MMSRPLAALVMLLAAQTASAEPVRIVVAIGANAGAGRDVMLRYATRDARRVARVFRRLGDVRPEHSRVVTSGGPEAVVRGLRWAANVARAHDDVTLLVYYSGHGSETHLHLSGQKLPLKRLEALVAAVPARLRVTVIDACRSGARSKGLTPEEPFEITLATPTGPSGSVVIKSSSAGEVAQESDDLKGAVFTHHLISGLRGGADADRDGRVTLAEAYSAAFNATVRTSGAGPAVQRPEARIDVLGAGAVVLTRPRGATAKVVLPPGADHHYLIYKLPRGTLLAEVRGRADSIPVAVPSGRLLIQRRGGAPAAAEVGLPWGGARVVTADDFEEVPYEALAAKGSAPLLHPHELVVGGGLAIGGRGELGPGLSLRYGYAWPDLGLRFDVDGARVTRQTADSDVSEWWAGLGFGADWRWESGALSGTVGGGVDVRWLHQIIERRDADRLSGTAYETRRESSALAVGPRLSASLRVALSGRWFWTFKVEAVGPVLKEDEKTSIRFAGYAKSGVGLRF